MAGLQNIVNKYTRIAKELPAQRQQLALIMATDANALVVDRIQNEGVGADGNKFKLYSENLFPYWFMKPSDFNASSKVTKFKKDASKGKNNGSYKAFRSAYGLPTDKRTLTVDNTMWSDIHVEIESHDRNQTTVITKASTEDSQNKVNWNSNQLNINILSYGEEEKQLIEELNEERVNKLLK